MTRIICLLALVVTGILINGFIPVFAASLDGYDPFYSSVSSTYMDDPRRNEWQKPDQVIEHLFIRPGETVADIGAGSGFFSMRFARKVGKTGLVYASDIDENMVKAIEQRTKKEGLGNIRAIHAKHDDPLVPHNTADIVFICDTYLFIDNRVQYLTRLKDSLKNDGRLAIISFNSQAEIPGAPPQKRMIPKQMVIKEALTAGYVLEADYYFLPFQDFLVFKKIPKQHL